MHDFAISLPAAFSRVRSAVRCSPRELLRQIPVSSIRTDPAPPGVVDCELLIHKLVDAYQRPPPDRYREQILEQLRVCADTAAARSSSTPLSLDQSVVRTAAAALPLQESRVRFTCHSTDIRYLFRQCSDTLLRRHVQGAAPTPLPARQPVTDHTRIAPRHGSSDAGSACRSVVPGCSGCPWRLSVRSRRDDRRFSCLRAKLSRDGGLPLS